MIASNLKIKSDKRDRLYFERFRYCLNITVQDLDCIRDITKPTTTLQRMAESIIFRMDRNTSRAKFWGGCWTDTYSKENCKSTLDALNDLTIELWPRRFDIKITFSGNSGYLYSNDLELLHAVAGKKYAIVWKLSEAEVTCPKDTVLLTKSNYALRSYFKERRLTLAQKKQLQDFLVSQQDVKITGAMRYWFSQDDRYWSHSYFFIDHNSELIITMLGLVQPGIIRKTWPIVIKDK